MSARDKKLLIYLGALVVLAAAYFLVGKPYLDKYDALVQQKSVLEAELADKKAAYDNQATYTDGIADANARIQKIMDEFPEDNSDEKTIMFASRAEQDIPMWFTQMKFADETKMMVNGQEVQSASELEAATEQQAVDAVENAENGEAAAEGAPEVEASSQNGNTGVNGLIWRDTEVGLAFQTQYEGYKKFLAYIRDYEDRLVIKEIDVTYSDEADMVSGTMTLSQYAILGEDRVLPDVITDVENIGTTNVFTNSNYGGSILDLLADMAADFLNILMGGLSEEALEEYGIDYFVKLNAVTNNTSGITIGRGDDVQGNTYITSEKNQKVDITYKVTGSDGNYNVTYKIGKSEYTDKISKDPDGKMYLRVVSTYRSSDSDKVGGSLRVINESDIPVVVGIEGDDPENPRVSVTEKSGNVTVNKK